MNLKLTDSTRVVGAPGIRLPLPLPLGLQMCPGTLSFYVGAQVKFKSSRVGNRQFTPWATSPDPQGYFKCSSSSVIINLDCHFDWVESLAIGQAHCLCLYDASKANSWVPQSTKLGRSTMNGLGTVQLAGILWVHRVGAHMFAAVLSCRHHTPHT